MNKKPAQDAAARPAVAYLPDLTNPDALWRLVANALARASRQGLQPLFWTMDRPVYDALRICRRLSDDWSIYPGFLTRDQAAKGVPADVVDADGMIRELEGLPVSIGGLQGRLTLWAEGFREEVGTLNG